MTDIREHLIELFEQTDFSKETPEKLADAVLWVADADGLVMIDDGELPSIFNGKGEAMSALEYKKKLVGYSKHKPII